MAHSWIAVECRSQAVLYLISAVLARRQPAARSTKTCPFPLIVAGSLLAERLTEKANGLPDKASVEECRPWVHEQFETLEVSKLGIPDSPWTLGELIGWWLAAGEVFAGLGVRTRGNTSREVRQEGQLLHPVLWCADQCERLRLSEASFLREKQKPLWSSVPNDTLDYRRRLLHWATMPTRHWERMPDDTKQPADWTIAMQSAMQGLRENAVALLGNEPPIRLGGHLALGTLDKWAPKRFDARVGGEWIHELRQPLIQGSKTVLRGIAALPQSRVLFTSLAELYSVSGIQNTRVEDSTSLSRATVFATSRWHSGNQLAEVWAKSHIGHAQLCANESVETGLLAVARWLTTACIEYESFGSSDSRSDDQAQLVEALRISLGLEGFQVGEVQGGTAQSRLIPHMNSAVSREVPLAFIRKVSSYEAPLGTVGHRASCGTSLFAAIEVVDWRLWALDHAPWDLSDDKERALIENLRQNVVPSVKWEPVKRQALQTVGRLEDESLLAQLFQYAHEQRLRLEFLRDRVYGNTPPDRMLGGLIEDFDALVREAIKALAEIDPDAPCRLRPPRHADGSFNVAAWFDGSEGMRGTAPRYSITWVRDDRPLGAVISEQCTGKDSFEVALSAGQADDTDLAILRAPRLATIIAGAEDERETVRLSRLLADLQRAVAFPGATSSRDGGGDRLVSLRTAFTGTATTAFDELIKRSVNDDECAAEWCRILRADPRFRFACHPEIDCESGERRRAKIDDPFLEWDFDQDVPVDQDVEVTYAIEPQLARRVISRGPRRQGSPADRAESLAEACRQAGLRFGSLGKQITRATDRWLSFGAEAPHPVTAAEQLLDELLVSSEGVSTIRTAIFEAAAAWFESLDHFLVPSGWRADGRLLPSTLADLEVPVEFDDHAPTGTVVVKRFGIRGVHGRPFAGIVSAGPAPSGFVEFRTGVQPLRLASGAASQPAVEQVLRQTDELAKHSLAGRMSLALPNLFDCVWEVILNASAAEVRAVAEEAVGPLLEMLKAACRIVKFEPKTLQEYSAGWIREPDGLQPRGRRLKRLVRPGLRTIENVLVRPALVISE